MEFQVLGPIEVLRDGVPLALGGPKQRAVLALLVASAGRPVSVDALINGVYGDEASPGARRTIHTYVSNLRREVGDDITRTGNGYVLNSDRIDARDFEKLHRSGRDRLGDDPTGAAQDLRAALALWRGHAYSDVDGRTMLDAEIGRLEGMRLSALEARIDADLALGLHRDLVGELEALTAEHPLRESFRAQQMVALYRSGRQSEALRAYGRMRNVLVEELGIDPSPELQELEAAILAQEPRLDVQVRATIERRAILAAELDDTLRFATPVDRDAALSRRDALLGMEASQAGGELVDVHGGASYAAFPDVATALAAARRLASEPLRLAVDYGDVEVKDDGVTGPPVIRALQLAAVGHLGQVLVSSESHAALTTSDETGWAVKSLGRHRVRGVGGETPVFQLLADGIASDFPPLLLDRLPPPLRLPAGAASVSGFELREEIGGGVVGIVHRAYQASVGREVAVRVVRPELVADDRFIRRFEAETQRVAALEHPHLVLLVDYWREPQAAYLVHRLIRGGDLRTRTAREPLSEEKSLAIVERVGSALAAAHTAGIAHGAVRPENILFDEAGHPYLAGLGLAGIFFDLVSFPADAYTAPELIGGHPTVAGDVHALGVLAAELLSGQAPPIDGALPQTGTGIDRVVAQATHPDPGQRYATVDRLLEELRSVTTPGGSAFRSEVRNPYKGLAAFREADAGDFFGRHQLTEALVEAVGSQRLTLVVGPSGIGKSSVVRAGLLPALRAGAAAGADRWIITAMFPGARPFDELEAALERVAISPAAEQIEAVRSGAAGLADAVRHLLPDGSVLLLVIDQFEELFTHVADEETRRRFLSMLTRVADDETSPVRMIATMRADFYDRPLRYAQFGELAAGSTVAVHAPSSEELEEIIRGPANRVGVRVTDPLATELVADSENEPGALPLLQHALTELFEARETDLLDIGPYRAGGGLAGSVGRRAEHIFVGFSQPERQLAREVFLRLVTVDEDTEDTRRRVRRTELEQISASEGALERVFDAFGRHRLLVFDRDAATRGPTVEVAHEALLHHWDRLRGWIDEVRDDLLMRRRVEIAARDWVDSGADAGYLLSGGRLQRAESWRDGSEMQVTDEDELFLAESRRVVDLAQARRRRLRRRIITALSAALTLAVAFGSFAWVQRGVAEQETISARVQDLTTQAQVAIQEDPDLAILLALEAYHLSQELREEQIPGEVMAALQTTTQASRLVARLPHGRWAVAVSPDGALLALDDRVERSVVHIYDAHGLEPLNTFDAGGPVAALTFTPDGSELAVAYLDLVGDLDPALFDDLPLMRLFSVPDWQETRESNLACCAWKISFSSNGEYFFAYQRTGPGGHDLVIVAAWDEILIGDLARAEWVPNSSTVAVNNWGEEAVRLVSLPDMTEVGRFETPGTDEGLISIRADGQAIAVTNYDTREALVFEAGRADPIAYASPGIQNSAFSPDGSALLIQGNDEEVLVVMLGGTTMSLRGHQAGSWASAFDSSGDRLFVPTLGGVTLVWDLTSDGPPALADFAAAGTVVNLKESADGRSLGVVSMADDGPLLQLVDRDSGELAAEPTSINRGEYVGFDATGSPVVQPAPLPIRPCETVLRVGGSPPTAAVLDACDTALFTRFVNLATQSEVLRLPSSENPRVEFGPDDTDSVGVMAFNPWFGPVEIRRVSDGSLLASLGPPGMVFWPRFSPDGRTVVFGSQDGVLTILRVDELLAGSSVEEATTKVQASTGPTNFSSAGSNYVASTHSGELVRIWDRDSAELLFELPILSNNLTLNSFTADERYFHYGDGRAEVVLRRLPMDPVELANLAQSRVQRDFTVEECERYLHDTDCSVFGET